MPTTPKKVVLAKVEATYGTDPTHAATDAHLVHDFNIEYVVEKYARASMSATFTPHRASVLGRRSVKLTFWEYMRGNSGVYTSGPDVVPEYDVFLRACSCAATFAGGGPTWAYTPIAVGSESVAIEAEIDGVVCVVLGCRGNARFVFTPGEPAKIEYEFFGLFTLPADRVVSAPDYSTDIAPAIVAATGFQPWSENPLAGVFGHVGSLVVDMRNKIIARQSLTVGAEGIAAWEIVGRGSVDDPGMAATIEVEQKASTAGDDFFTRWNSRTVSGVATATIGSGIASNEHAVLINDLIIEDIQFGDNDGRVMNTLDCRLLGDETAGVPDGNDEFSITAT